MRLNIGKTLTTLLSEQRLSVKEVAKSSGVPASTIGEWKLNRTPKNPEQVLKVAKVLGVSLHHLLFGEEDRQEPINKFLKEDVFQGIFEISIKRVTKNK